LFEHAADCETLAGSVADNGGVFFVPALAGLGAPHWDPHARGAIFGITRGTTRAHVARAALESIALQVDELLQAMADDSGESIAQLRIDGGAAANNLLVQFQADIAAIEVVRPANLETTALGAAYLAGIAAGWWSIAELNDKWRLDRVFHGTKHPEEIAALKRQWLKAVERAKNWVE
jgi:glycerol kinase